MSGPDIEARTRAIQEQNLLVRKLRESGNVTEGDRLQETFHARELSGLADDVYQSASHKGDAPVGWMRASSNPEALRAAGVDLSDAQLNDLLQPPQSGFRAEIYIPDKRVFGDSAKIVIVYKGSTGEIVDSSAPGGRRGSGPEDFLNNGQQGVGLRSDYYDRAMLLAVAVKRELPGNFELAGHSLGGGLASAASAVTGARATTFNAAGLHPATAPRFAMENGLPTFNTQQTVRTYQTVGDVLSDVQSGIQRLTEQQRHGYGVLVNEVGALLKTPGMQQQVTTALQKMMPPEAQASAAQFIEHLASASGQHALRTVPLAAGRIELVLQPRSRDAQGVLVDRPQVAAPSQVAELAGPLSAVLHATGQGMRAGRQLGEQVAHGGAAAAHGLDRTGDTVERVLKTGGLLVGQSVTTVSTTLQASSHAGSTLIASGRELRGSIEATLHRAQSQASARSMSALSWVADRVGLQSAADRLAQQAASAREQGEQSARHASTQAQSEAGSIRAVGQVAAVAIARDGQWVAGALKNGFASAGARVDRGHDLVAARVQGISASAPAQLAAVGGVGAGAAAFVATHLPTGSPPWDPLNQRNLEQTTRVIQQLSPSFDEAGVRHSMAQTVIPSLDAALHQQEAAARVRVEAHGLGNARDEGLPAPALAASAPQSVLINDSRHADFGLFKQAQKGVHALDAAFKRQPDRHSEQLAGALAAQAKCEGITCIDLVLLSKDRNSVMAVDDSSVMIAWCRQAHVGVMAGMSQPLAVSTAQADAFTAERERAQTGAFDPQQVQQTQQPARQEAAPVR